MGKVKKEPVKMQEFRRAFALGLGSQGSGRVEVGRAGVGPRTASDARFPLWRSSLGLGKGAPAEANCGSPAGCRGLSIPGVMALPQAGCARNSAVRGPTPARSACIRPIPCRPAPWVAGGPGFPSEGLWLLGQRRTVGGQGGMAKCRAGNGSGGRSTGSR